MPSIDTYISSDDIKICYFEQLESKRQIYRNLNLLMAVTLYIILICTGLFHMALKEPDIITRLWDGKAIYEPITPIRNPKVTDRQVINWSKKVGAELLTFHFQRLRDLFEREEYFIDSAFDKYLDSILATNTDLAVKSDYLIVHASYNDEPLIISKREGLFGTEWGVRFGVVQTVKGASNTTTTSNLMVTMYVTEVDRDESTVGLKIISFYASR
jgi:hypothetical protein